MTRVLSGPKLVEYAERRLFSTGTPSEGKAYVTPDMVKRIELHNGILPSGLILDQIERQGNYKVTQIVQENSREPIFFHEGTLLIPQYSGFGRAKRYQRLVEAYTEESGRDIEFVIKDKKDKARKTIIAYDNDAYDFVKGMFIPEPKYEEWRVFPDHTVEDISAIVIGPLKAVAKQADEIIDISDKEYLGAQIVRFGNVLAVNLGYVYADQAGVIIDKMLREYTAAVQEKQESSPRRLDICIMGRAGGLEPDMKRHDLIFPRGAIDLTDLKAERRFEYPFFNSISPPTIDGYKGCVLNVETVIDETLENLKIARSWRYKRDPIMIDAVEMELRESAESINKWRRRANEELDIHFSAVLHISDLPLQGDTLATELDSDQGEQAALEYIVRKVKKKQGNR